MAPHGRCTNDKCPDEQALVGENRAVFITRGKMAMRFVVWCPTCGVVHRTSFC